MIVPLYSSLGDRARLHLRKKKKDLTILSIYLPHTETPRFIKQLLLDLRKDFDNNRIIVVTSTPH